uniref:Uncharacterized protein n=1 Tax=Hemiselmis andersenii TaxID=464988 RepID=A0A7S1E0N9_HEMAN
MPASAIKKARTVSLADAYDRSVNYMNRLRLDAAYKAIAKRDPHAADHDEFFSWPGDSWTKKGGVTQLAEEEEDAGAPPASRAHVPLARGSFPLARGGLEGQVGNLATGEGVMDEAFVDPVSGRPLVRTSPFNERRYRLTEEAAARQAGHELRAHRAGAGEEGTPLRWFDHSREPQAGPSYDAGTWKLGRIGVRV